jgi:hypothetical protein
MKKTTHFGPLPYIGWPATGELEPYFLAPPGREWSYYGKNDSWGFTVQGLDDTEHLPEIQQVTVRLYMTGNPKHGVNLLYDRWDGRDRSRYRYNSKGDLSRLREVVYTTHGTGLPVGLFIPFRAAWPAVKEFIETDGELPKSIDWIGDADLPPKIFPDPGTESA